MPAKDGSALKAQLVDGGCHNFISKRSEKVLKATKDQRISTQAWRIPSEKISINAVSERLEEAVGIYAKEECSIPADLGNYACADKSWSNWRCVNQDKWYNHS